MQTTFRIVALSILLGTIPVAAVRGADPTTQLSDFIEQLKNSQSGPSGESYRREASAQFKALQVAIKRGNYEQAQQLLQNLGGYGVPSELQDQWGTLADTLAAQIDQLRQQSALQWKTDVDVLAKETREACVTAKVSDDLQPVLIACSALQLRRISQNSVLVERANQRLQGIVQTLQAWSNFLDAQESGNAQQANNALRNLMTGGNGVAVLPRSVIESSFVAEEKPVNDLDDVFRISFANVKTTADLPVAIERLQKFSKNPAISTQGLSFPREVERLQNLTGADAAIKAGNLEAAAAALDRYRSSGGYAGTNTAMLGILNDLQMEIITRRLTDLTKEKPESGEVPGDFVKRVADQLRAKGQYEELGSLVDIVNATNARSYQSSFTVPWSPGDATAIRAFLIARQFEAAGDTLASINQYRTVISAGQGGRYAPVDEARKSLEKLKTTNPEAFKDVNAVVLVQLQALQEQLRSLPFQIPRGPGSYPGGYPR